MFFYIAETPLSSRNATRHLHIEDPTLRIPEVLRGQVVRGHVAILHQVQTGHLGEWQRVTFKQLGIG